MLVGFGVLFACENLWIAACRSTIPLELHGTVTRKQRLVEKKPGIDDVYMITLDSNRRIQIDRDVYQVVGEGISIHKTAWSKKLDVDGQDNYLVWSRDFQGMLWVMPITMCVCVLMCVRIFLRVKNTGGTRNTCN